MRLSFSRSVVLLGVVVAVSRGGAGCTAQPGVEPAADAGAEADAVSQFRHGGERRQVALDEILPGGERFGIWRGPPAPRQETGRGLVYDVPPGGEEANVAPVQDGGADGGACLEHDRVFAPGDEMGGGGESDGAAADDRDGEFGVRHGKLRSVLR